MKSSAMNQPDERLVYLALRSVFTGEDAKIRSVKLIRKQIQKHGGRGDVKALMDNHNQNHVYSTAKQLLEDNVFESTQRAKIRFPEVFSVSPAQSATQHQLEEEVARSEANAIRNAVEGRLGNLGSTENMHKPATATWGLKDLVPQTPYKYKQEDSTFPTPSLYPIYLPFETQHRLLKKVQDNLERSCYTFAEKSLGEELQKNGWDCPERVELHVWSRTLVNAQFSDENTRALGKPLTQLLESIADLRHTAVHRIEVLASRIRQFLLDAEALTTLLGDDDAATRIARQRGTLELAMDEIKGNKEFLSFRAMKTIGDLDDKIAAMKQLQKTAVDEMFQEDSMFRRSAVADLEIAIDIKSSSSKKISLQNGKQYLTSKMLQKARATEKLNARSTPAQLRTNTEDASHK